MHPLSPAAMSSVALPVGRRGVVLRLGRADVVMANYAYSWSPPKAAPDQEAGAPSAVKNPGMLDQLMAMIRRTGRTVALITPTTPDHLPLLTPKARVQQVTVSWDGQPHRFDVYKTPTEGGDVYLVDHPQLLRQPDYLQTATGGHTRQQDAQAAHQASKLFNQRALLFNQVAARVADTLHEAPQRHEVKRPQVLMPQGMWTAPTLHFVQKPFAKAAMVHEAHIDWCPEIPTRQVEVTKQAAPAGGLLTLDANATLFRHADTVLLNDTCARQAVDYAPLAWPHGAQMAEALADKLSRGRVFNVHHPVAPSRVPLLSPYLEGDEARKLGYISFRTLPDDPPFSLRHATAQQLQAFKRLNKAALQSDPTFGLTRSSQAMVLAYTGRVDPYKGILYLTDQVLPFLRAHPDTQFIYCGRLDDPAIAHSPVYKRWLADLEALNTPKRRRVYVSPPEGLPPEQIVRIHAGADVLLHPSLIETFGVAPLEAMINGTPCIGLPAGGMSGVVCDPRVSKASSQEHTGYLIQPKETGEQLWLYHQAAVYTFAGTPIPEPIHEAWQETCRAFGDILERVYRDFHTERHDPEENPLLKVGLNAMRHVVRYHHPDRLADAYDEALIHTEQLAKPSPHEGVRLLLPGLGALRATLPGRRSPDQGSERA